jgi:hypothetical protein
MASIFFAKNTFPRTKDSDHYYFRKEDDDGSIRVTRVSKGTGEIIENLWKNILKIQLKVSKEYFNKNS